MVLHLHEPLVGDAPRQQEVRGEKHERQADEVVREIEGRSRRIGPGRPRHARHELGGAGREVLGRVAGRHAEERHPDGGVKEQHHGPHAGREDEREGAELQEVAHGGGDGAHGQRRAEQGEKDDGHGPDDRKAARRKVRARRQPACEEADAAHDAHADEDDGHDAQRDGRGAH